MNCEWNFLVLLSRFILFVCISSKTIEARSAKIDQVIVAEPGENVTLLCNPSLRENLTLSSQASDFEWMFNNDIPIFVNGKLSRFLFDQANDVDNSSFAIDTNPPGTLILRKISYMDNTELTCSFSTHSTKISYSYRLKINQNNNYNFYTSNSPISSDKRGNRVILPCTTEGHNTSTSDSNFVWLWRMTKSNNREDIEVISLNRNIFLKNNSEGFQVTEDRSLVIPSLTPRWPTTYECRTINQITTYYTAWNKVDESDPEYSWNKTDIAVELGNDVSLKCPEVGYRNFVWIRNSTELLFVNGRAVKNSKTDNLKIDYDEGLLTITNFTVSLSGTYTCSGTNHRNYLYNVTKRAAGIYRVFDGADIFGKNITLECPESVTSDSYTVWTRNSQSDIEVLFINGYTTGGNKNNKLKTANNGRSLVIADFSYRLGGVYSCHLDTGINSTFRIIVPDSSATNLKKQSFSVDYGTRNLVLPCPAMDKNTNSSYQWFFSTVNNPQRILLFINQTQFKNNLWPFDEYYKVNENGSLVILVVRRSQYGEYTCRRNTGEQYVYNLNREYKFINETISIKGNTNNITLLCPVNDPRDQDFNVTVWSIMSKITYQYGEFTFVDGKMMPVNPLFKFPENVKLADDKTSLIVSNLTSTNLIDDEYLCELAYSSTVYKYLLTNY